MTDGSAPTAKRRRRSRFSRFVTTLERHAWWVIAAWLGAAVVLTVAAPSLNDVGSQDTTDFLPHDAPSQRADRILASTFPNDPTREAAIVVAVREGGLTASDRAWLGGFVDELTGPQFAKDVRSVQSAQTDPDLGPFLRSDDGAAELVIASMARPPFSSTGTAAVEDVRDLVDRSAPDGLEVHVTGIAGLAADQAAGVVESFDRTAIVTVVLVLVILIAIYRSIVAPLIPLVTIGLAFGVANGVVAYVADAGLKVNTMVGTFLVVMVFGAGTDYCLFLTSRYREDLAAGDSVARTVVRTTKVIGGVIAASAATVIVGFSSMLTADFGVFRTMGPAIAIAIFITLVAGLTLTPALLRVAGERAFWPRRFDVIRATSDEQSPRWQRVADLVQRRPRQVLLGAFLALIVASAGLGWYHQSFDLVRDLPAGADAREGFETLARHYPGGTVSPVYVIVTDDGSILADADLEAIDRLTDQLRRQPGVAEVRSVTQPVGEPLTLDNLAAITGGATDPSALGIDLGAADVAPVLEALRSPEGLRLTGSLLRRSPELADRLGLLLGRDGSTTRLIVALDGNPYENRALDAIRDVGPASTTALQGTSLADARVAIGGPSSFYADMREISNDDFRVLVVVIVLAIFLVLAVLLRSVVAPIYLLATVILSYAATVGITVAVFQGVVGDPGITFWLTPFLFVILVALGADYNIFIMSRVREEADAGHEIHAAVRRGLTLTGRVITSAGVILAGTFAALMVAPLPNLRQIGFGVTIGILIDTFIVRSLLVPAATMLLGNWAFWPRPPGHPARTRTRDASVNGSRPAEPASAGSPDRR